MPDSTARTASRLRPVWAALLLLLALAAFLRFETWTQRPLWGDELATLQIAERIGGVGDLISFAREDGSEHPTLHPLIVSWWIDDLDAIQAVRLPSVLSGIASVALLAWLGALLFRPLVGGIAGFLLAVSVYHVNYSQDGRAYALVVALTIGQYLALYAFSLRGRGPPMAAFALLGVVSMYAHHVGVLVQVALFATHAVFALLDVRESAESERRGTALRQLAIGAATWGAMGLLYLPQLVNTLRFASGQAAGDPIHLVLSARLFHDVFARWGSEGGAVVVLYEILVLIGAASLWRSPKPLVGLTVWLLAPFGLFAVIPFDRYFDARYLIAALPAFFLLAARGIVWSGDALAQALRGRAVSPHGAGLAGAAALLALLFVFGAAGIRTYDRFRATELRCSQFPAQPEILKLDDEFCARYLILNSIIRRDHYLVTQPR